MSRITRSPLFSTLGILAAGSVFAYAIYSFYPQSDEVAEAVPVIKAESIPMKIEPVKTGGMDIPFQDSTVYDSMRRAENTQVMRIENLLEPAAGDEEPMSREDVIAQVEEQTNEQVMNITEDLSVASVEKQIEEKLESVEAPVTVAEATEVVEEPKVQPKRIQNILQEVPEQPKEVAKAETTAPQPATMHKPAASPETLAFVRSVLDKKDTEKLLKSPETNRVGSTAQQSSNVNVQVSKAPSTPVQKIEPAAGTEVQIITKGSHYVQLASITDRTRANKEWANLKEQLASAIPSASGYRVQEANLPKGTFFRIQAGPYSEAQAKSICESIKMQKPGGCLVVQ